MQKERSRARKATEGGGVKSRRRVDLGGGRAPSFILDTQVMVMNGEGGFCSVGV